MSRVGEGPVMEEDRVSPSGLCSHHLGGVTSSGQNCQGGCRAVQARFGILKLVHENCQNVYFHPIC